MSRSRVQSFRASTVKVDGVRYQIQFGRPGHPRIYRMQGRTLRRVAETDPVLPAVARAYQAKVEEKKRSAVQETRRRRSWHYRFRRWLGRLAGRFYAFIMRGIEAVVEPFGPRP